ncbi:hypothetical protein DXG03_001148 [Asterophora parasitica]|uniref:Uncharacterized protein n=1 Tax=Asterophora parasitica TaxID=117018 RepID=A0A9P7KF69_9AGAR|nr:hypothetical protein DXG03_001148 [Asterophora parasitica]
MAGTKRTSPESGTSARASKVAKTESLQTPSKAKKGAKKGIKVRRIFLSLIVLTALNRITPPPPQPAMPVAAFKATALPVHVNLTHTPPTIADPDEVVSAATADPGFIGNLTLVPSSFSTGSYGWKGSKRITIELQNTESDTKEKVQVMLSINATVLGSKPAKSADKHDDDEEEEKDEGETSKDEEEAAVPDDE